jgi:hypothetical protein
MIHILTQQASCLFLYQQTLEDMKITAVVLHNGLPAHYTVSEKEDGWFEAHLLRYGGARKDAPPQRIRFVKEGRHCTGDTSEQELMDELCAAVKYSKQGNSGESKQAA